MDNKAPDAFRTISEVADELDLPQHVLRFWESRFREIKPMKRGGGRRYYRPEDIELLRGIKHLLYGEGYTIRGVQRILREQSVGFVQEVWQDGAPQPPHITADDDESTDEVVDAEDDAAPLEERRGLRERFSSLIGRDLGDRGQDSGDRREPPLQSAPMPRLAPEDRPIYDIGAPQREPVFAPPPIQAPAPTPVHAPNHAPMPQAMPAAPAESEAPRGVAPDHASALHAALNELMECRKLIDSAMAREQP
ncbi:MAG: MerR family transcriptional regulator [Pseudolabrys sp.]|nr:MerR family transcriptional regulator [Pseudolabrys sp.]